MSRKRIGVVLSGCGVYDGSEIHESVLALYFIYKYGAEAVMFAPNKNQMHVINHLTHEEMKETRNVLVESARIARGNVKNIQEADPDRLDGLIFPGGYGAAKNLSDFAVKGAAGAVDPGVEALVKRFHSQKKPIGFICISPASVGAMALRNEGVSLTIGSDKDTNSAITSTGNKTQDTEVDEITVDENHNIISTSAYMCAKDIAEAGAGIEKLVLAVLERCGASSAAPV